MTLGVAGPVALVVYLLALAVVAEVARRARADRSPADHFLASRSLGPVVLLLTMYATAYSGNSLLGYPGEAYRRGFSWIMATGFMSAVIVMMHALVPVIRPAAACHGLVSPGDWIRQRYGDAGAAVALRVGIGVVMSLACVNYLLAQLTAMGHVTAVLTGQMVPHWMGVVGLGVVILAYETVGGMRAVAWTDALQGAVMMVALALLAAWVVRDQGGLGGLTAAVAAVRPAAVAVPDRLACADWASNVVLLGVGSVVYPQMIQRVYAAESSRSLHRALAVMTLMPLVTTTVVVLVGVAAIVRFPGLTGVAADTVLPRMLALWAEGGATGTLVAAVVLLGALAAIMSTADSVLLSLGSVITSDVAGRPRDAAETTRFAKRTAMVAMAAMVLVALNPRFTLWRLIELKMEALVQCAPAFVLGGRLGFLGPAPVLAGLLVGLAGTVTGLVTGTARLGGVHVGVVALGANVLVAVTVGALQGRRSAGRARRGSI